MTKLDKLIDQLNDLRSEYIKCRNKHRKQELVEELQMLKQRINKRKTKLDIPNSSMSFTKLISFPDSYEKLTSLKLKLEKQWNKKAEQEVERLEQIKDKLVKKKKIRLTRQYQQDSAKFDGSTTEKISISNVEIDILISRLYSSFTNKEKFEKNCILVRLVLSQVLPVYKQYYPNLYKKYYSVYFDVTNYLRNNFSARHRYFRHF